MVVAEPEADAMGGVRDERVPPARPGRAADAGAVPSVSAAADDPTDPPMSSAPLVRVLGPVDVVGAGGRVEPSKRARLTEYAAYLALSPGASHTAIDDAIWPSRPAEENLNTRNTATSKLRAWLGQSPEGADYLPRHQGGGYRLDPAVRSDWDVWGELLEGGPVRASTERLEEALRLVRGRPFDGVHPRRYAWAEPVRQRMIAEIVDASYELARRRLWDGRWRAAEAAVVTGLMIEPAQERLWRMRILAAHESRDVAARQEAVDRLLAITDELGGDLEPETAAMLDALRQLDRTPREPAITWPTPSRGRA